MHSTHFDLHGKPFHALTAGPPGAPCLLFLHGFPEFCGGWADVIPHLSDRFHCVAPDQRGYGQSWRGGSVADYAPRHLAADAIAMIDRFGQGKATVIGHDWGASVAYAVAMRARDKVEKLIIANGVHPVPFQTALAAGGAQSAASRYIEWLRAPGSETALAENDFEGMFALFSRHMDMGWLTEKKRAALRRAWRDARGLRAMIDWYRATPLKVAEPGRPIPAEALPAWDADALRITMPHLLLWGMNDTALLPEARAGLPAFCDDLWVVEYADADHWIAHQKPGELARQIAAFASTGRPAG